MVNVTVLKTTVGFESIRAVEHAGDPLVCAAVSAIMQGLAGTLINITPKPDITSLIIDSGVVDIAVAPMFEQSDQNIIDTVFLTAYISLKQIERSNPDKISISEAN